MRRSQSVSCPYRMPSACQLGQLVSLCIRCYASVYDKTFPSWRCLAARTSYFLSVVINLRAPSLAISTHTLASNSVALLSPAMPNARTSLRTQSIHSFSFPPRPLHTAPSRFPSTIHFGNRPPLIRMSTPRPQKKVFSCSRLVVSVLSHPVISRARL